MTEYNTNVSGRSAIPQSTDQMSTYLELSGKSTTPLKSVGCTTGSDTKQPTNLLCLSQITNEVLSNLGQLPGKSIGHSGINISEASTSLTNSSQNSQQMSWKNQTKCNPCTIKSLSGNDGVKVKKEPCEEQILILPETIANCIQIDNGEIITVSLVNIKPAGETDDGYTIHQAQTIQVLYDGKTSDHEESIENNNTVVQTLTSISDNYHAPADQPIIASVFNQSNQPSVLSAATEKIHPKQRNVHDIKSDSDIYHLSESTLLTTNEQTNIDDFQSDSDANCVDSECTNLISNNDFLSVPHLPEAITIPGTTDLVTNSQNNVDNVQIENRAGNIDRSFTTNSIHNAIEVLKSEYQHCPVCEKDIDATKPSLHFKVHELEGERKCKKCYTNIPLNNEWVMDMHSSGKCTKPFKCRICAKFFSFQGILKSHRPELPQDELCENIVCGPCFINEHLETEQDNVISDAKCKNCDKNIPLNSSWITNIHSSGKCSKPLKCEMCARYFSLEGILKSHGPTIPQDKLHESIVCGPCFSNEHFETLLLQQDGVVPDSNHAKNNGVDGNLLTEHNYITCTSTIQHLQTSMYLQAFHKCPFCKKKSYSQNAMRKHCRAHKLEDSLLQKMKETALETKNYKCNICEKVVKTSKSFLVHLKKHRVAGSSFLESSDIVKFKCSICMRVFALKSSLCRHQRKVHPSDPDVVDRQENSKSRSNNRCGICSKLYSSRAGLMFHLYTHRTRDKLSLNGNADDGVTCQCCGTVLRKETETQSVIVINSENEHKGSEKPQCMSIEKESAPLDEQSLNVDSDGVKSVDEVDNDPKEKSCQDMSISCTNDQSEFKKTQDTMQHFKDADEVQNDHNKNELLSMDTIGDVLKCVICNAMFPLNSLLDEHLRRHRVIDRLSLDVFSSFLVGSQEEDMLNLESEVEQHTKMCDTCNLTIDEGIISPDYTKLTTTCHVCNKVFPNILLLQKHKALYHDIKLFQCYICGAAFKWAFSFRRHNAFNHDEEMPFQCSQCDMGFIFQSHLLKHKLIHTGIKPFSCNMCGELFKTQESVTFHNMEKHGAEKPFQCSHCGKGFLRKCQVLQHETTHSTERPYKCTECDQSFKDKRGLTFHQKTHVTERKFKCTLCDTAFKVKDTLRQHMTYHDLAKDKPFQCTKCHKGFNHKWSLKSHNIIKHSKLPFECKVCKKRFAQMKSLKKHELAHTGGIDQVKCLQCQKQCPNTHALKLHVKRVHLKLKTHKCTICRKRFRNNTCLLLHLRQHKCQICGKKYKRLDYVVNHMRVHSGERPFKCVLSCGKVFVHHSVLIKHQVVCVKKMQHDMNGL